MLDTIVLSPELSRNYVLNGRYTFGVGFGRDVKRLRGDRSQIEIATAALGPHASEIHIRDLANYLSRIERDRVPNVGLGKIRLIAKGLGFDTLTEFFRALEDRLSLPEAQLIAHNTPHPPAPVAESHDAGRLVSDTDAVGVAVMFAGVSETLVGIRDAVERLADRVEQVASPRRPAARRRESAHSRRAKAG